MPIEAAEEHRMQSARRLCVLRPVERMDQVVRIFQRHVPERDRRKPLGQRLGQGGRERRRRQAAEDAGMDYLRNSLGSAKRPGGRSTMRISGSEQRAAGRRSAGAENSERRASRCHPPARQTKRTVRPRARATSDLDTNRIWLTRRHDPRGRVFRDGWLQPADAIRRNHPGLPVMLTTGHLDPFRGCELPAGVIFVQKSYYQGRLSTLLRQALGTNVDAVSASAPSSGTSQS